MDEREREREKKKRRRKRERVRVLGRSDSSLHTPCPRGTRCP